MSIINEYLVMLELNDSQKKDWVNTLPLNPYTVWFFFLSFFLGAPPLSFSLLYCLLFPVIGSILTVFDLAGSASFRSSLLRS